jgi:hypothetical protein
MKFILYKDIKMSEEIVIEEQKITFDDLLKEYSNGEQIKIPTARLIYIMSYIYNSLKQTDYSEENANEFLDLLGEIICSQSDYDVSHQTCINFHMIENDDEIDIKFCDAVPVNLERKCVDHKLYDYKLVIEALCEGYENIQTIIDTFNQDLCLGSSIIDIKSILSIIKSLEYHDYYNLFINTLYRDYKYIKPIQNQIQNQNPIQIPITIPSSISNTESDISSNHYDIYCNGATKNGSCKNKIPKSNKYFTIDGYKSCSIHNGKNSVHSSKLPIINSTNTIKSSPTSSTASSPSTTCGAITAAGNPCKKKCSKDPSCVDSNGIRRCSMHATTHTQIQTQTHTQTQIQINTNLISDKSKCHGKTAKKIQCSISSKIGLTTIDGYPACTKHSGKESIY